MKHFYTLFFLLLVAALVAPVVSLALVSYPPGALLQPNDVTSSHIRNNTIVDADVSTSAALDWRKVVNNTATSTGLTVHSNGRVGIATTTPSIGFSVATTSLLATTTVDGDFVVTRNATTTGNLNVQGNITVTGSCIGCATSYMTQTYTAGEALSAGQAVMIAPTAFDVLGMSISADTTQWNAIGSGASSARAAQSFAANDVGSLLNKVTVGLRKNGSPVDNIYVQIQTNAGGIPSGIVVASSSVAASGIPTSCTDTSFTLNQTATLTAGETYWLVLMRSGSYSGANYIGECGTTNPYANGGNYLWNESTWSSQGNDITSSYSWTTVQGNLYKSSAANANNSQGFIGFMKDAATYLSSSATVIIQGRATGLSGLTPGTPYYVSDTRGAIGTSAGTVSHKACIADSSTTCIITNVW